MASEIFAGYENGFWAPARPGGNQPSEILACYDSGFSAPTWPGGHHPADPDAGESVVNYKSADGEPSRPSRGPRQAGPGRGPGAGAVGPDERLGSFRARDVRLLFEHIRRMEARIPANGAGRISSRPFRRRATGRRFCALPGAARCTGLRCCSSS